MLKVCYWCTRGTLSVCSRYAVGTLKVHVRIYMYMYTYVVGTLEVCCHTLKVHCWYIKQTVQQ